MRAFQAAYIGRHEFPINLSEFEMRQWFTFDERDRRGIRRAFRSRYWIGAALHLGFLAMTGTTSRSIEYVPGILLRHLGRQFMQKAPDLATLRSLYRRSQMLYEHQRWAAEQWSLGKFTEDAEKRLDAYLAERTHATLSANPLQQMAYEWLYRGYLEIPRRRVITDLVRIVIHGLPVHIVPKVYYGWCGAECRFDR
jgi:hypothetical protein